jgi:hypothetical protein
MKSHPFSHYRWEWQATRAGVVRYLMPIMCDCVRQGAPRNAVTL